MWGCKSAFRERAALCFYEEEKRRVFITRVEGEAVGVRCVRFSPAFSTGPGEFPRAGEPAERKMSRVGSAVHGMQIDAF